MLKKLLVASAAFALLAGAAPSQAANLIINGGFDTGTFAG